MRFQTRREKKQVEKRKEQLLIREADKQKTNVDSGKKREKQCGFRQGEGKTG